MKKHHLETIIYILTALGFCIILGSVFGSAKAEPTLQKQPTVTPQSYFEPPIEQAYNPCKDPYLQYERSEESEQRRKQCDKVH